MRNWIRYCAGMVVVLVALWMSGSAASDADGERRVEIVRGSTAVTSVRSQRARDASAARTQRGVADARKVIGNDDRVRVFDTLSYPYTAVCKVFSYWPDGSITEGSAILIERRLALTAGHNLYDTSKGQWAEDVEIVPAYRPDAEPFGSYFASTFFVLSDYVQGDNPFRDMGALYFDTGNPGFWADRVGYEAWFYDSDVADLQLETAGYPGDLDLGERMYRAEGGLVGVDANLIYYEETMDTFGGQSGSGVWRESFGRRIFVVGVHVLGLRDLVGANAAARLTPDVFRYIKSWKRGKNPRVRRTRTNGRIKIKNRSFFQFVDVWLDADNDGFSETFVATLGPRERHVMTGLERDRLYRLEFDGDQDDDIDEGASIYLRRRNAKVVYRPF